MTVLKWNTADDFNEPQSEAGVVHEDVGGNFGETDLRLGFPTYVDQTPTKDYWERSGWWHQVNIQAISSSAVYDATANKTFITFQSSLFPDDPGSPVTYGQARVAAFDHATGRWQGSVFVDNLDNIPGDGHGSPSIVIDSSGFLHVFYGAHNSTVFHAKSTNARDHTEWTLGQASPESGSATYPQPFLANGAMYVFYRLHDGANSSYDLYYVKSADDGATWGAAVRITNWPATNADADRVYPGAFYQDGASIHIPFQRQDDAPASPVRYDPAYMRFDATNDTFYRADGAAITLPIEDAYIQNNLLVVSTTDPVFVPVVRSFAGVPWVFFDRAMAGGTFEWQEAHWDGTAWTTPVKISDSRHQFNGVCIAGASATDFDVYFPQTSVTNEDTNRGGPIMRSHYNGTSYGAPVEIYSDTNVTHTLNTPVHPKNAHTDVWVLFWESNTGDSDPYQYLSNFALDSNEALQRGVDVPDFVHVFYPANEATGTSLIERGRGLPAATSIGNANTPAFTQLLGENVWDCATGGWSIGRRVLPPQDDFSLVSVVNADNLTNPNMLITGLRPTEELTEWFFRTETDGTVVLWVRGWDYSSETGYSATIVQPAATVSAGAWLVLGVSKTGRSESNALYKVYLDGAEVFSGTRDFPVNTGFWYEDHTIGANKNSPTSAASLDGKLGPHYIVSGYAMTAAEHANIAAAVTGSAAYTSSRKVA